MKTDALNVVLVHGAWADGSGWRAVIDALQAPGVTVVAAPLPLTSFADDVAALDRVLERLAGPVVLVAHAYAGAVIAATRDANVAALVYIAALAPDEGETVAQVFGRAAPHPSAPALAPDARGWMWFPRAAFAAAYAQHATPAEHAWLAAVQRPLAAVCIGVPVGRPLWRDRPSWFLVAEDDRMIAPATQRFMAERMGASIRSFAVDHTPSVSAPDTVVAVIREAMAAVSHESVTSVNAF
jgi:pimeloyl-ACP methyl ester carboxylesterase